MRLLLVVFFGLTIFFQSPNQYQHGVEAVRIISDVLLATFTGLLVWVGCLQTRILKEHEKWMEKHDEKLKQLADATNKNADAARTSAETAEKTLRITQRADIKFIAYVTAAGEITIELRNEGKTVGRNVTILGDFAYVDNPKSTSFRIEPLIVPTDAAPKAVISTVILRLDNYGQRYMIADIRCNLNIIYEDIFKDTHTPSYLLNFDRISLRATVEKESS